MTNQNNGKPQPIKMSTTTEKKSEEPKNSSLPIPEVSVDEKREPIPAAVKQEAVGIDRNKEAPKPFEAKAPVTAVSTRSQIEIGLSNYMETTKLMIVEEDHAGIAKQHLSFMDICLDVFKNTNSDDFRRNWTTILNYTSKHKDFFCEKNLLQSMHAWTKSRRLYTQYTTLVAVLIATNESPSRSATFTLYNSNELLRNLAGNDNVIHRNLNNFYSI